MTTKSQKIMDQIIEVDYNIAKLQWKRAKLRTVLHKEIKAKKSRLTGCHSKNISKRSQYAS